MTSLLNGNASLGDYESAVRDQLARYEEERLAARLWERDPSLWSDDPEVQQTIANRLGWLSSPRDMRERLGELDCVRTPPYQEAVLLGMGGSSLAPEVFQRIFGNADGSPRLHVLDNTTADAVQSLRDALDLERTLFIVASKSGTTTETSVFADYFYEQTGRKGEQFVAITDPGSLLAQEAQERGYAACFLNPEDIGGRYSVLSFFGLVPATIIGLDVQALLDSALREIDASSGDGPAAQNEGLVLGVIMGELAAAGRDKLTIIASPTLEPFGDWAEQLVAESTGKEGRGLLPVVGERVSAPDRYGPDRLFVYLRLANEPVYDGHVEALKRAGHPVVQIDIQDLYDLGAQFFRWEFATAVAGAVLGINPFDEPNVTESKNNSKHLLERYQTDGSLPFPDPRLDQDGIKVSGVVNGDSPEDALLGFVEDVSDREYIAIMAYMPMTTANRTALHELQTAIRNRTGAAVTLGFGPRFLHSTGQFHKGGPASGRFIQIVAQDSAQVPIPGKPYDFTTLASAQALGDMQALVRRGFAVTHLFVTGDTAEAVTRLTAALEG
ncbi:MAG TPA: hypothetical protein VF707_13750 [Ardenticatenaceae bacterium]|jgi:glucose-6-phosphate isomerase